MKRNDFATFLTYVIMFVLALCAGLFWIRDLAGDYSGVEGGVSPVLVIILSIVAGILLNSLLLELGHLLGAKIGHYRVLTFVVLYFGFKRKEDGKKKFGFQSFNGLTGETKVAPKDAEKSSLGSYIVMPLLFFLVEVALMVVLFAVGGRAVESGKATAGWLPLFAACCLVVGGMVYIYDYIPAHLDSPTDGYLMILLSKRINKKAYNDILLAEEARFYEKPLPEPVVYDELTDLTFTLNLACAYSLLKKGSEAQAIAILNKAIESDKLSNSSVCEATSMKLSLLLSRSNKKEGVDMYSELKDSAKKYISNVSSPSALRCYVLISGLLEESETEANFALDKVEKVYKQVEKENLDYERKSLELAIASVKKAHPTWELPDLPWAVKKEEPKAEPSEAKDASAKPTETKPTEEKAEEPKQGEDESK